VDQPHGLCQWVMEFFLHIQLLVFALQLMMCGQTPEAIAESALVAMNFYVEQQRLSGMYENHKLKQKMEIIQTQCREKLVQMQHAYQQVSDMTCLARA
jgi:hypothetical protein